MVALPSSHQALPLLSNGSTGNAGFPKPPRSAFICFSDAISHKLPHDADILKEVAKEWNKLNDKERAYWDEEARNDKLRYVVVNLSA